MKLILHFTWLLLPALFSFNTLQRNSPVVIQGTIVSAESGKPISQAHVYIIHGEEEALTDSKGNFRIETWQKLPLKITVAYKDHVKQTTVVSDPSRKQTIRLKSR